MNKAIFFVKDVLLIPNISDNIDSCLIAPEDDIISGLKILQMENFKLIVVTNQPEAALGPFAQKDLETLIGKRIRDFLEDKNILIDGFYYYHNPYEKNGKKYVVSGNCRQPEHDGMLFKAAEQLNINLSESWMIGNMLNDVETGNRSGCRTILIDNGNEKEWYLNEKRVPDLIAKNINEAANLLLVADELLLSKDTVNLLGFS